MSSSRAHTCELEIPSSIGRKGKHRFMKNGKEYLSNAKQSKDPSTLVGAT